MNPFVFRRPSYEILRVPANRKIPPRQGTWKQLAFAAETVALQAATPGTAQTGHAAITGTMIAGMLILTDAPTSDAGLPVGAVWVDTTAGNVLKLVT